jgi:hypothetical protein
LPKPNQENLSQSLFVAPSSDTEKDLASMFTGLLNLAQEGIDDNFFILFPTELLA